MKRVSVAILLLAIITLAGCSPQTATESEEKKEFPDIIVTSESGAVASVVSFGYTRAFEGGFEFADAAYAPPMYSYDAEKTLSLSADDAPDLLTITGADYTVKGCSLFNLTNGDVYGTEQPLDPLEAGEALTIEAPSDVGEYAIAIEMSIDDYNLTHITYAFKIVVS
ncbi:MAG: hypothetical protein LBM18_02535 [Oscillospiraceae bacterium]|nr:hypothetical protein [Oscillospiraceae bacterium]